MSHFRKLLKRVEFEKHYVVLESRRGMGKVVEKPCEKLF
jgi:hypothetical protein